MGGQLSEADEPRNPDRKGIENRESEVGNGKSGIGKISFFIFHFSFSTHPTPRAQRYILQQTSAYRTR